MVCSCFKFWLKSRPCENSPADFCIPRFLFLAASRWNHSQWHWKNSRGYNETVDISLTATHVFLSNPRGFLVPCKVDFYHIPLCIYFCYVSLLFVYIILFLFRYHWHIAPPYSYTDMYLPQWGLRICEVEFQISILWEVTRYVRIFTFYRRL